MNKPQGENDENNKFRFMWILTLVINKSWSSKLRLKDNKSAIHEGLRFNSWIQINLTLNVKEIDPFYGSETMDL